MATEHGARAMDADIQPLLMVPQMPEAKERSELVSSPARCPLRASPPRHQGSHSIRYLARSVPPICPYAFALPPPFSSPPSFASPPPHLKHIAKDHGKPPLKREQELGELSRVNPRVIIHHKDPPNIRGGQVVQGVDETVEAQLLGISVARLVGQVRQREHAHLGVVNGPKQCRAVLEHGRPRLTKGALHFMRLDATIRDD